MVWLRSMSPSLYTSIKAAMKPLVMLWESLQVNANSNRVESPKFSPFLSCGRQLRHKW
jgi:hypothetical protein